MFDRVNNHFFLSAQQKEGPAGDFQRKDGKGQPIVTDSFQMRVGSLPIITLSGFFNQKECYCNNQKICLYDYLKKVKNKYKNYHSTIKILLVVMGNACNTSTKYGDAGSLLKVQGQCGLHTDLKATK